jgi:hypothetical protein
MERTFYPIKNQGVHFGIWREGGINSYSYIPNFSKFQEKLLIVPLHMLASVGFVKEEALNIVALRIGEIDQNADIYDLALIYTKTSVSLFSNFRYFIKSKKIFRKLPKKYALI